jgi:hypothetical protein
VTVPMREVARRFVELQSAVGAGGDVDSSMLSAYRSAMTADELAVAELVGKFEEEERRKVSRKCLPAVPPEEGGSGEAGDAGGTGGGDAVSDSGDGDSGDGDEGNDGEGGGDPPPEPGFARGFKRR